METAQWLQTRRTRRSVELFLLVLCMTFLTVLWKSGKSSSHSFLYEVESGAGIGKKLSRNRA